MPGKNLNLRPLALRKRLLLAESDLNRAHMLGDWQRLRNEVHALAHQAKTVVSIVAVTTSLVAGVQALRRKKTAPPGGKPSWLQSVLNGTGLISNLWSAFRPRNRD